MSKHYRAWKIDETHLLPPSVQDYAPERHLSRFIAMTSAAVPRSAVVLRKDRGDWLLVVGTVVIAGWLILTLAIPLAVLLIKSVQNSDGAFVGLANFARYIETPALLVSLWNSVSISALTTAIVLPLAFGYAYALRRTAMPLKALFTALVLLPLFAPSLLSALSFIYIFGNQGILKSWLMGETVYGPIGIVISMAFYTFPYALLILMTALGLADQRHYEAAKVLGTPSRRVFWTVTLPGAKYGLISAGFVVFTLSITEFGIPKVIGGQFNVLATDAYKQVVGSRISRWERSSGWCCSFRRCWPSPWIASCNSGRLHCFRRARCLWSRSAISART